MRFEDLNGLTEPDPLQIATQVGVSIVGVSILRNSSAWPQVIKFRLLRLRGSSFKRVVSCFCTTSSFAKSAATAQHARSGLSLTVDTFGSTTDSGKGAKPMPGS